MPLRISEHNLTIYCQGRAESVNWGGGCIFIYSCYARLISFEINPHDN